MAAQFRLKCETIHCFGKKISDVGSVESREEAELWRDELETGKKKTFFPNEDPVRTCPVVRCPLKLQKPRYDFIEVDE